jgi:hypothetical protein
MTNELHTPAENLQNAESQPIANVLLSAGAGTNDGLCIGFTCKICDGTQTLQVSYYRANDLFPVCNECLKDLKEFVLSKRGSTCH